MGEKASDIRFTYLKKIFILILFNLFVFSKLIIIAQEFNPEYYKFTTPLPDNPAGFWVVPKSYLKDMDPEDGPAISVKPSTQTFATQGESEPVTFVIYAVRNLKNITVTLTNLTSGTNKIEATNLSVRTVMRAPQRENYWSPADKFVITNRFLPEFKPFDLNTHQFREIWVNISVPPNTPSGIYTGRIKITPENGITQNLSLSMEVFPFTLKVPANKRFGFYYSTGDKNNYKPDELIVRELQDIAAHHGSITLSGLQIGYKKSANESYTPDYSRIVNYIGLLKKAEFPQKEIVVNTGFEKLAEDLTGITPQNPKDFQSLAAAIPGNKKLAETAQKALSGLMALRSRYKEYNFIVTQMDEVFNEGRLPVYIELSKLVRQYSDFPLYVTFHTRGQEADSMRKIIDPYVDIRANHGYTFEDWLSVGHTPDEYQKELQSSGDVAWQYHNPISWFINAKWQRLINGLYMWDMPFSARVDWIYSKPSGNPLDDLDGDGHDFGYAFPVVQGDKVTIVPTRNYEGWKEGIEDLWYLYTLEQLIARNPKTRKAQDAEIWLQNLKEQYPDFTLVKSGKRGTPQQSPVIYAMDQSFSFDDLQRIRYTAAQYIINILKK